MKLISMVEFVLQMGLHSTSMREKGMIMCNKYANFLSQPLELGMFVPCDEEGNVYSDEEDVLKSFTTGLQKLEYQQAKERVLFESKDWFFIKDDFGSIIGKRIGRESICDFRNCTVESLVRMNITLTQTAIKQIGL